MLWRKAKKVQLRENSIYERDAMVVFDTSVIVDALRGKKPAIDLLAQWGERELIATTVISKYELLRGAHERDATVVAEFLKKFVIYDFQDCDIIEVVKAYKSLNAKGLIINELDFLIAGIAAANKETLVTRDKDFLNFQSSQIVVVT
jgi:predicted nucleic acid-binding protein